MKSPTEMSPKMKTSAHLFSAWLVVAAAPFSPSLWAQAPSQTVPKSSHPPAYNTLILASRDALDSGKLKDAFAAAMAAACLDDKRFEAYSLGAAIQIRQGDFKLAGDFLREAHQRAPANKQSLFADLDQLVQREREKIAKQTASAAMSLPPASNPLPRATPHAQGLSPESRRRLEILRLILEDIDKSRTTVERRKFFEEFMAQSETFLTANPSNMTVWMLRAISAIELNQPHEGWEAGRKLIALGADNSKDRRLQSVMARLERKDWLTETDPGSSRKSAPSETTSK